jgi:hypothetical protein
MRASKVSSRQPGFATIPSVRRTQRPR